MKIMSRFYQNKMWHDLSVTMSILIIVAFTGFILKDHMFASIESVLIKKTIHEVQYRISSGDTLWRLASSTVQPGEDVRDKIIAIRTLNGLTPNQTLIPGQIVRIPINRMDDNGMRYAVQIRD